MISRARGSETDPEGSQAPGADDKKGKRSTAKKRGGSKRRGPNKSDGVAPEPASRLTDLEEAADLSAPTADGALESGAALESSAATEPDGETTPAAEASLATADDPDVLSVASDDSIQESGDPIPELTPEEEAELPHLEGDRLRGCIESILFASPEPVTRRRLYRLLPEADKAQIRDALLELEGELLSTPRGYFLVEDSAGFRFLSKAEFAPFVARLRGEKRRVRLSAAAFETLAVIAYRQPARRADLEAIRGVQCGAIIKNLMEWNLLRVLGHDDSPGRPLLYGTTGEFLEMLGLSSLSELPEPERLRERGEDRGLQVLDRIIDEGGTPAIAEDLGETAVDSQVVGSSEEGSPEEESPEEESPEEGVSLESRATVDAEAASEDEALDESERRSKAPGDDEFDLDLGEDEE